MSTIGVIAILGLLAALWLKIKSYFQGAKTAKLKSELQETKDEASKKVGSADAAAADFEHKLRDYKAKRNSDDNGK